MADRSGHSAAVQLRVDIRDADPSYVAEKVGEELYVHLRAVPAVIDFRRAAIERARAVRRLRP